MKNAMTTILKTDDINMNVKICEKCHEPMMLLDERGVWLCSNCSLTFTPMMGFVNLKEFEGTEEKGEKESATSN